MKKNLNFIKICRQEMTSVWFFFLVVENYGFI